MVGALLLAWVRSTHPLRCDFFFFSPSRFGPFQSEINPSRKREVVLPLFSLPPSFGPLLKQPRFFVSLAAHHPSFGPALSHTPLQRTNNHDLLSLRMYTDPNDAWEVDTYDDDEDELDSLMHHMEHELFGKSSPPLISAS